MRRTVLSRSSNFGRYVAVALLAVVVLHANAAALLAAIPVPPVLPLIACLAVLAAWLHVRHSCDLRRKRWSHYHHGSSHLAA